MCCGAFKTISLQNLKLSTITLNGRRIYFVQILYTQVYLIIFNVVFLSHFAEGETEASEAGCIALENRAGKMQPDLWLLNCHLAGLN